MSAGEELLSLLLTAAEKHLLKKAVFSKSDDLCDKKNRTDAPHDRRQRDAAG